MASTDSARKNREFSEALGANFVILSDPNKEAARAFGVLDASGESAQRSTFYIDSDGLIRHIDRNVNAGDHGAAIAAELAELGFPTK